MLFSPRGGAEKVGGGAGTHAPASVPPAYHFRGCGLLGAMAMEVAGSLDLLA
jgi:hypothetical protein